MAGISCTSGEAHKGGSPRHAASWLNAAAVVLVGAVLVTSGLVLSRRATSGSAASIAWLPEDVARWTPHLESAAVEHGVDADLLAIITLVESRGIPSARSPRGAMGLMQIMPRTATRIAEARGLDGFSVESLSNPTVNLDFGAWYLARQLEQFGTVELAVAAYNGGPKRVRAMLAGKARLSRETARYRDLVQSLWQERDEATSETFERRFGPSDRLH